MKDSIYKNKAIIWLSAATLLCGWALAAEMVNNEVIIPTVSSTVVSILEIVRSKHFTRILTSTMSRSCISFLISIILAVFLGVFSGLSRVVHSLLVPLIALFKAVPTMAIIILALIWLGSSSASVLIGVVLVFPMLYESVVEGMLKVDAKLIQMANLYSVSKANMIIDIYMPAVYSYLSLVIGASLGLTLKAVIAGEVLGQPKFSIGGSLQLEKMYLNTSAVFAWIIIVVALSALLEQVIKFFFAKTNNWR